MTFFRLAAAATSAALLLTGCSGAASDSNDQGGRLSVVAGTYVLAHVAEQVGGDRVEVVTLTPPGGHPHDLELTPKQVVQVASADLVMHLPGLQPALDEAIAQQAPKAGYDAYDGIALLERAAGDVHADEAGHADEEAAHADEGGADPHVWLDPANLVTMADNLAERLAKLAPADAEGFRARAQELAGSLGALDSEFSTGLGSCRSRTIVVAHQAFGYLAKAYDLQQVAVTGISPDAEPSPARLADITQLVREQGITTVFTESQVDAKVAQTIAQETGVQVLVLDPIESVQGSDDYASVMRRNLDALRNALDCS